MYKTEVIKQQLKQICDSVTIRLTVVLSRNGQTANNESLISVIDEAPIEVVCKNSGKLYLENHTKEEVEQPTSYQRVSV